MTQPGHESTLHWTEHINEAGGTMVHYATTGAASLPQLVLLHGFRSNRHGLDSLASQLAGYRLICPDIPGFGETPPGPQGTSLSNQAQILNAFLEQSVRGSYVLVGHSLGATVALLMAAQPTRGLKSVILINPVTQSTRFLSAVARVYYRIAMHLPESAQRRWFGTKTMVWLVDHWMFRTGTKHFKDRIIAQDFQNIPEVRPDVFIDTSVSYDQTSFDAAATRVAVPSYCLGGDSDPLVPKRKFLHLAGQLTGATVQVLPGRGHLFPVEEPAYAATLIKAWLETQG